MSRPTAYPARVTRANRPYWEAVREGRLATTRCRDCERLTFPPKIVCPGCWSRELEWAPLAGTGVLRSYTEVCVAPATFAADAPYVLGLVDLDEGLRCLARIEAPFDSLRCDQRVRLAIDTDEDTPLLRFAPTQEV